ncbi:hypothetical protein [Synechococcus phage Ssp-JY38]
MENISLRSDGFYETPSGKFAVVPRVRSGSNERTEWFEFKASVLSEVIRIEWPKGAPVIVLDAPVAKTMLNAGYALHPDADEAKDFNDAVDKYNKESAAQSPTPPTPPATPETPTPSAPAGAKTGDSAKEGDKGQTPPPPPPAAPQQTAATPAADAKEGEKAK